MKYEAGVKMKKMDKDPRMKNDVRNIRHSKKERSNESDTLAFLKVKNVMESEMKKEEMEQERRNMKLQEKNVMI